MTVSARFLNPAPHVLRRTFTLAAVIARLARFLNGLPAAPGGITSCPAISITCTVAFKSSAAARPYLVASASGCGVGITVNGRAQPGLAAGRGVLAPAIAAAVLPLALLVVTRGGWLSRPTGAVLMVGYVGWVTAVLVR